MNIIETMFFVTFFIFFYCFFYQIYKLMRQEFDNKSLMFINAATGFMSYIFNMMAMIYYTIEYETNFAISYFVAVSSLLLVHFIIAVVYFMQGFTKSIEDEVKKIK